jgi:hypothetical protein
MYSVASIKTLSFRTGSKQLRLLATIQKSASLKKQLIQATNLFTPGMQIRMNGAFYVVEGILGSGLIGTVYQVKELSTGNEYALKHTRAQFSFYRESLRIEQEVEQAINSSGLGLTAVPVVALDDHFMLKELCLQPTLQEMMYEQRVEKKHQQALEKALLDCKKILDKFGVLIDLSPKNIVWDIDRWKLIDAGPKLHQSPLETVLEIGTWESYVEYMADRVHGVASEPSVLGIEGEKQTYMPDEVVFMADWMQWFPLEELTDPGFFYVETDLGVQEDEFVLTAKRSNEVFSILEQDQFVHPFIRLAAIEQWKLQFPDLPLPSGLRFDWNELPIYPESEPINWNQFLTEISSFGLGKQVKNICPAPEHLPTPTLKTKVYKHWKALFNDIDKHEVIDIFCHEPLECTYVQPIQLPQQRIHVPLQHGFTFANVELFGNQHGKKAVLILPGFRATNEAAYALVNELNRRQVHEQYIVAQIGVKNPEGNSLVTAGRWELVVLWEILEYCIHCLGISEIDIIAASHGAIAAWSAACLHPVVNKVVLDSPLLQPLKLLSEIAKLRGESNEKFMEALRENGMPYLNYTMFSSPHPHLKVLSMRPEKDLFMDLCGNLQVGEHATYLGGHASTLRHDSSEKGIPSQCLDSMVRFLTA